MSRGDGLPVWIAAARPRTLPAAVAPVVVGSALAGHDGRFDAAAASLCLVFALLVQVGTNFANDYFDFIKGADTAKRVGPVRAVASGRVRPEAMRLAAGLVFAAAFISGMGLVARGGPWMIAVGIASIVCGIAYTGGPFPLGYNGLGDVFVFVFFGLVAVGVTYFVQAERITADVLIGAVPMGLLITNLLVVNNYRDSETDRAAGKRTMVVRLGRRFARVQFALSLAVALAAPIALWARGYRATCLLPMCLAPLAWSQVRRLRSSTEPAELIALLGAAGRLVGFYAALFAAGVLL